MTLPILTSPGGFGCIAIGRSNRIDTCLPIFQKNRFGKTQVESDCGNDKMIDLGGPFMRLFQRITVDVLLTPGAAIP